MFPEEAASGTIELGEDEVFVFPLSYSQQRLWVLDRLEPNSSAYNIPIPLRLKGELNVGALRDSLTAILQRHEVLRTTFAEQDGAPVQVVPPPMPASLGFTDLSNLPYEEREKKARDLVQQDARTPFDLSRGPIFRTWLLKLDQQDHVLALNVHHIAFDGWSQGVLLRELFAVYAALARNQAPTLPELPLQYAHYAIWQRERLSGERLALEVEHWRQQLAGAPASLDLPLDHPRPPVLTYNGAHCSMLLSGTLLEGLQALSRQSNATLFMTLLAAFNILLARYSGQEDIVVGSPIAGRNQAELEKLVGFFVSMLPLRLDLSGRPNFRQLLQRVRTICLSAYAHHDVPFEKLVEELKPERDISRNPIFQVLFALQNMPHFERTDSTGLRLETFAAGERTTSKFELSLYAVERPDGLRLLFEYNTDLFERATIERMGQHFQTLLEGILANPYQPVIDLPMLTPFERRQLLADWNDTRALYPDCCIHELFEGQANRTPNAIALISTNQVMTYRELNSRANQLARYLTKLGVTPETLVAVGMERSPEMGVALLGILKAGGAYVPLDQSYPRERLRFMLSDSAAPLLLTNKGTAESFSTSVRVIDLERDWTAIASESIDNLSSRGSPDSLAYVIYTSGSTGQPKGVLGTHRGAVNRFSWMWSTYPFQGSETCCQKTSLSFVDSVWEIFGPLLKGVKSVIIPDEVIKDTSAFVGSLATHGVTRLVVVPSLLRTICEMCPELETKLPSLKCVVTSGEALTPEVANQFLTIMPQATLLNLYGSTEVAADCTCYRIDRASVLRSVPIGRPLSNTQAYVLDSSRQLVPIGVAGELYVGGDCLARGYLHRPELTAERFIDNPFHGNGNNQLYKTGDRARFLADGNIEYLGRSDLQVKLRGFRIELGEIETVLTQHPAVKQAVVVVREDRPGDKRLVAYLVAKDQNLPGSDAIRAFAREKLPEYMVPSHIVVLEQLPLTPNGKVDRKAMPAVDLSSVDRENEYAPPKDELEAMLVSIWRRVLGISSVGVTDNFFELGGHSLLAVRLMAEIQKITGVQIPLATLFGGATVQYLAEIIRQGSNLPHQTVLPIQEGGSELPFFGIVVPGMNALGYIALARHLGPNQPVYRIQAPGVRPRGRSYSRAEFENLAAEYVKAIKTVQPHGPYYFGGMCEGARIAFDMARLLEAQHEEVDLLAIFDTWVMENSQIRFLWKVDYYWSRLKRVQALSFERKRKYIAGWFQRRFTPVRQAVAVGGTSWPEMFWPGKGFVPPKFAGKITVFKNPKQPYFYIRDPLMGWGSRSKVDVELHVVNSHHGFFMREPYVQELAQTLSDCLRQSRTQTSARYDSSTRAAEGAA